ncbi:MAG TPA: RNA-binding protein [Polyangiaceae bacterium]
MNKLFVGNLDDSTSAADLERIFGEHGSLVSAVVISDRYTGNSRGFGFVEYASGDAAERAVSSLNGADLRGRALVVSVARDRKSGSRR